MHKVVVAVQAVAEVVMAVAAAATAAKAAKAAKVAMTATVAGGDTLRALLLYMDRSKVALLAAASIAVSATAAVCVYHNKYNRM